MDIHKPKPWHGWAEFLKEIGTIVIGVLIALGAEQTVEWLHRSAEIRETREAINEELVGNVTVAEVLLYEDRCLLGVGDRIMAWANGGPRNRAPTMVSPVFTFTIWDLSAGPVSHMPLKEKFADARFYEALRNEQSLAATTRAQATRLGGLGGLPSLTPAEARTLMQNVSEAHNILAASLGNAEWILRQGEAAGLHPLPLSPRTRELLRNECDAGGLPAPDFDKPAV